jgi:hypothetical protein
MYYYSAQHRVMQPYSGQPQRNRKGGDVFSTTAVATSFIVLLFLPVHFCIAGEEEPIVWTADDASFLGIRQISLYPSPHVPGESDEADAINTVRQDIRTTLQEAGINVSDAVQTSPSGGLGLEIHLVHYASGNVGGRWVGFGGGAAICIVRTILIDGQTGAQIGDIVIAEQIGGGGLFSIGAGKHILHAAARKTAEELTKLLGVRKQQSEDTQ